MKYMLMMTARERGKPGSREGVMTFETPSNATGESLLRELAR